MYFGGIIFSTIAYYMTIISAIYNFTLKFCSDETEPGSDFCVTVYLPSIPES
jgi:hypothetical protein